MLRTVLLAAVNRLGSIARSSSITEEVESKNSSAEVFQTDSLAVFEHNLPAAVAALWLHHGSIGEVDLSEKQPAEKCGVVSGEGEDFWTTGSLDASIWMTYNVVFDSAWNSSKGFCHKRIAS